MLREARRPKNPREMIAQVLADAWQIGNYGDTEFLQELAIADTGELEELWALDGSGADHDLLRGTRESRFAVVLVFDASCSPPLDTNLLHAHARHDPQVSAVAFRIEVGLAAALAHSPLGIDLQVAHTLVLAAVVVGVGGHAGFDAGAVEGLR